MQIVRQSYGCDCDGVSHLTSAIETVGDQHVMRTAVRAWLGAVESVVGMRPETCPWRALRHPLVIEAADVCALAEKSLGMARLGADPPAILLDAIAEFEMARSTALAHNLEQKRKEDEAKRQRR